MKLSQLWLNDWVHPNTTIEDLAHRLTMSGFEVDSVDPVAGAFDNVVVAKVLDVARHPEATKLHVCQVEAGLEKPLQIVCGAANVRAGLVVALAKIGAVLPGDVVIKEAKLRGESSFGMLCSASELGLCDQSEGILELPLDAPIGIDLRDYLKLDDKVLEVNVTPNRGDCLSVLGLAREVSVIFDVDLNPLPKVSTVLKTEAVLDVKNHEPYECSTYAGRLIQGIHPQAQTPFWIKERLRRAGIRLVHPVVDCLNYVMIDLGQPMHAYDASSIVGGVHVRHANPQEKLKLLDGQELILNEKVLLVADDVKAMAIAGVMGADETAVVADTVDVWLESAHFDPVVIAGVARAYGLNTDASQRFERGVDSAIAEYAIECATSLLCGVVGGKPGPLVLHHQQALTPKIIEFNPEDVKKIIGIDVTVQKMQAILQQLGMNVTVGVPYWKILVPTHRFDLNQSVDVVEEIIRIHGYEHIKAKTMQLPIRSGKVGFFDEKIAKMSAFLSHRGYHETISYGFVEPKLQSVLYPELQAMVLQNPISSDLSEMRVGLWPGLIASMIYNVHRQQSTVRLFEAGVVFNQTAGILQEQVRIAGILTGETGHLNWAETTRFFDFYDMKGDVEALCALMNLTGVEFLPASHPALHPGQSAEILCNKEPMGWIGVLHPELQDELGIDADVVVFELKIDATKPQRKILNTVSKYPKIRRDLSFLVGDDVLVSSIEHVVADIIPADWLKSLDVFDVYQGKNTPLHHKSIGIALTLQDACRTLVDEEINLVLNKVIKQLERQFNIVLREAS